MTFEIRMGVPEMAAFYDDERRLFKKLLKALKHLRMDPRHPGLQSHEIEPLSEKYGQKVFQLYLDQGETADRLFWTYGPGRREITILGIAPHPESGKRGAYKRVQLSEMPPE